MTEVVTKKQLDIIIQEKKEGNYISFDDGKWYAVKLTDHSTLMRITNSIISATRFLLGMRS